MSQRQKFTRFSSRRTGVSMVLFVLSFPVIIGITGLVIDLTNLYTRRAYAQRAADAAALAGAEVAVADNSSDGYNASTVRSEVRKYARLNGYSAAKGATITIDPVDNGSKGKVKVTVSRDERVFFTPVLEMLLGQNSIYNRRVGATATAEKTVTAGLDLGGNYGTTTGASNPAAFGPYALHSYGDPYSVLYHDDGTPNTPENVSKNKGTGWDSTSHYNPDGYTYTMTVSKDFVAKNQKLRIDLFDPDGYDSKDGQSLDEIHNDHSPGGAPTIAPATTQYTLYKVNDDGSLQQIATAQYGNDQATDAAYLKSQGKSPWFSPDGFKVDTATYGAGQYKIRVKTIDGSSENGYNLRAGPDYADYPVNPSRTASDWNALESDWNNKYGDKGGSDPANTMVPMQADDHLQMNFTRTAPVKVRLGYLPPDAAGQTLSITKFDTDVGSTSIKYSFVPDGSTTPQYATDTNYLTPTNDYWSVDKVSVPADFKGGYWYAEYNAGQNDTSSWSIKYPGLGDGTVGLTQ